MAVFPLAPSTAARNVLERLNADVWSSEGLLLSRSGNLVSLTGTVTAKTAMTVSSGAVALLTLVSGFRVASRIRMADTTQGNFRAVSASSIIHFAPSANLTAGTVVYVNLSWITIDAFPTVLPGTAA